MSGLKILIVEDNVTQAESLGLILKAMGHRALLAGDGRQGQAQVETHGTPDGVILDLRVPGEVNGRVFLAWMRGRPELADVPVVVTTGLPADETADVARMPRVLVSRKPETFSSLMGYFAALGLDLSRPQPRPDSARPANGGKTDE